ncbi:hypothetical protein EVAR_95489_1 [Eumeta japonica]|uniref:Nucleolar 27S pre-rRNA processing Urb2/Npa2 C-terminal domain-containing protein n=1 Tax=Eumeta variegata TaxID=151549 RepID=A0A4C1UIS1_EUMVA|nr:hypothetical protein EVAR_95489_1 [Eumeta japonica]
MIVPPICIGDNSDKLKRNLFLNMVNYLIENEVGIDVSLTETFGEKSSRVDVKKNFMAFLQTVMLGQIKLDGKIDKLTIQILKSSLRLDPMLIEQKMDQIIPTVMCAKKNNHTAELYADMLEYLLDVLFKLSRGMLFINQMLPHIKIVLEASNTDQFELKQKIEECERSGQSCDKMVTKIIRGEDLFPKTCVERFGRLTCELMFRQNADLLLSLQRDFEEQCIYMLEEGFVSPSIITITEVMSAILSSMLDHSKMADHTVPELIAQEFWKTFDGFQKEFLKKFGECVLKLNYNPQLTLAFLKLSLSIAQLKILNHKYASVKAGFFVYGKSVNVFDLSLVLPCLNADQWAIMAGRAQELEAAAVLNNLLLLKIIVMELLDNENRNGDKNDVDIDVVKEHLIKECLKNDCLLDGDTYFSKTLLVNLNKKQMKQIAKGICKILLDDPAMSTIKNEAILNNKQLLLAFVMEVLKRLVQFLEEPIVTEEYPSLSKCIVKTNFLLEKFLKEIDFDGYIKSLTNPKDFTDGDIFLIVKCLEILKQLKIQHLGENCQLSVVFVLLSLKKACGNKKVRKNVDNILQMSFELSSCCPDLYKIYPLDYIFDLDSEFLSLITLSSKINGTLIIKSLLEMTVKKVKTDSEIIKKVVKILLSKQKHKKESNIECFGDNVFQIICMILPIISKEKKSITTSTHRSVLADLQEKLHKSLLKSFKNIEFSNDIIQSYEDLDMATPNAIEAYTLTLSKYCESTDAEAVKDLVCLWSGLEYFAGIAMSSLENAESKLHHVGASIQLLNIALRHIKKLETHSLFQNKDEAFSKIWHCLKKRLHIIFSEKNAKYKHANDHCLEEMAVTVKFLCELSSVDCFRLKFVEDLYSMMVLKKASSIEREVDKLNSTLTIHLAAKKLWRYCLKSNITAPKCAAISKQMYRTCKNQVIWIRNNYDIDNIIFKENVDNDDDDKLMTQKTDGIRRNENSIKISDVVCEIIKTDVDSLCEVILASKKILLDYKFIDAVFELQQMLHFMLGLDGNRVVCDISWKSFFIIFEGSVSLLNALVLAREELLEDRWPCFLQNYRMLVLNLCKKSSSTIQLDRSIEDKLAEISHTIEKLTYSLCKKKNQISRLAAYVVADICYQIEKYIPPKHIRQHLENSVVLLIQVADSTHAMAFLRRALAGNPGQMTMTNLYTMYKRYHKKMCTTDATDGQMVIVAHGHSQLQEESPLHCRPLGKESDV